MRILQFAPRICWPLDTGAKLRNYHLARGLSEHVPVTLLAFTDHQQAIGDLAKIYQQVIVIPRDRGYTTAKILQGGLGRTPLPVLNYTTDLMKRELANLLSKNDFDVVQIESVHLINYLPTIREARPSSLVVCDWHNIESELIQRYAQRDSSFFRRAYARRTARLMREYEQRALQDFDAHIVVSERDAERLHSSNSNARIFVIENGVDANAYVSAEPPAGEPATKRIIFVGSMDYHANVDAVTSFAREVWPALRARQPETIFTIVGKDPAPQVRELTSMPGVEVTGTVDSVRPYYREALAAVVPLKVGGGSRLKILEAMAAGVPVVSTTLGAEGLDVSDDENILIADTNEQLIEAILSLIENAELRERLVASGRALVSSRYDWSLLGNKLFETYQRAA